MRNFGECFCDRHRNEEYPSEETALAQAARENDEREADGEERIPWRPYCCPTSTSWHLSAATPAAFCRQWTHKNGTARRMAALLYLNGAMVVEEFTAQLQRPGWAHDRVSRLVQRAVKDFARAGLVEVVPGSGAAGDRRKVRIIDRAALLRVVYIGWTLWSMQNPREPVPPASVAAVLFDPSSLGES